METKILNAKELLSHFQILGRAEKDKELHKGLFVSSKIRKEILISIDQNRITLEGLVYEIQWESVGSGVYRAFVTTKNYQTILDLNKTLEGVKRWKLKNY